MANTQKIQRKRSWNFGSIREWHWISSAICLMGMLLFSITGITLNHAAQIKSTPKVHSITAQLPTELMPLATAPHADKGPLPQALIAWLATQQINVKQQQAEWRQDEIYLALPRPGGDAWLSIDVATGETLYEATDRGWIAYFNDLHKARNTGQAWVWFVDIFAIACIIFCMTGFILLQRYAGNRPATWPLFILGIVLPWVIILLFIH